MKRRISQVRDENETPTVTKVKCNDPSISPLCTSHNTGRNLTTSVVSTIDPNSNHKSSDSGDDKMANISKYARKSLVKDSVLLRIDEEKETELSLLKELIQIGKQQTEMLEKLVQKFCKTETQEQIVISQDFENGNVEKLENEEKIVMEYEEESNVECVENEVIKEDECKNDQKLLMTVDKKDVIEKIEIINDKKILDEDENKKVMTKNKKEL